MIALPLLLRPIDDTAGECWDATSIYGYAGPVVSHKEIPRTVVRNFQQALHGCLREKRVISLFSRLHPLLGNEEMIAGLGGQLDCGETISINLRLSTSEQENKIRDSYRKQIKKLRRSGYSFVHDVKLEYISDFVDIYADTMRRVDAHERYFFSRSYFDELFERLRPNVHLMFVFHEGIPVAGGIFIVHRGIVQYHLSGTRSDSLHVAPGKMLLDEVRLWACAQGYETFHLGGGVGGRRDSLFGFKKGFSDCIHSFSVWQWVLDCEMYEAVCRRRAQVNLCNGVRAASASFFPLYRSPVVREWKLLKNGLPSFDEEGR